MNKEQLENISEDKAREYLALVDQLSKMDGRTQSQNDFLSFVKTVWPTFIEGAHHRHYAKKLQEDVEKIKDKVRNNGGSH